MSFAEEITRAHEHATRVLGEQVTHVDAEATETLCYCLIRQRTDPVLVGSQIQIREDHYTGRISQSDLAAVAEGDEIVAADETRYEVAERPELFKGMWQLVLRRLPA